MIKRVPNNLCFIVVKNRFLASLLFKKAFGLALILLFTFLPLLSVEAAPNYQINYQGKLHDSAGDAVTDGDYDLVFKLYTASSGGTAIWTESHTGANDVAIADGLFSVMLGSITSIASVNFNQTLYLGVTVEADSEMTPRKILGTVPSAFEADKLDGLTSTDFISTSTTALPNVWSASGLGSVGSSTATTTFLGNLAAAGSSIFNGILTVFDRVTSPYFVATSTSQASIFPYASTTMITATTASTTNLIISGLGSGLTKVTNGVVSLAAAGIDYLASYNAWSQTTNYNTTMSATTSPLWAQNGLYASSTSAFAYASTTALTISGTAYIGSLNGPLQANGGTVSATSTIGVRYGGTGLTTDPTYGLIPVGNGTGYTLTATSSLGIALSDITGILPIANGGTNASALNSTQLLYNNGTRIAGTSTPTASYFIATSTELASVFPYASTTAITVSGQANLPSSSIFNTTGLGIGKTPSVALDVSGTASSTGLQVNGNGVLTGSLQAGTSITVDRNASDSNSGSIFTFQQRSSSGGNVASGQNIGRLRFAGLTAAAAQQNAAIIRAVVDGTPGSGDIPGRLEFLTAYDGGVTSETSDANVRLTIKNDGKSGFGTTTPGALLSASSTSEVGLMVDQRGTSDIARFLDDGVSVVTIKDGGNVGIGTTTPGSLLSLGSTGDSTINLTPTGTSTFGLGLNLRGGCYAINSTCIGSATLSGGTAGMLTAWTSSSALTATGTPTADSYTATSTSVASVFPYASSTAITTSGSAFFAQSSGQVGVGTSTVVTAKMEIGGTQGTSAGAGQGRLLQISGLLNFNSSADSGIAINVTPDITNASASTLNAMRGVNVDMGLVTATGNLIRDYAAFAAADESVASSSVGFLYGSHPVDSTDYAIYLNTSDKSYLGTGNVGIGTTTPQWLLNPTSASAPQLALSAGGGLAQWAFRNAGGNLYVATTTTAGTATSSPAALSIVGSTGFTGFGIDIPTNKFTVNLKANQIAQFNDGGASGSGIWGTNGGFLSETSQFKITSIASVPISFHTGSTLNSMTDGPEWGRLATNGLWGFGTTTPGAQITASSSVAVGLMVDQRGTDDILRLLDAGTNVFTIRDGGNVGIGTTTPGSLLSLGSTGDSTINLTPTGTSTFGLGLNLRGGCYAINSTCIGGSGGSGTVNSGTADYVSYYPSTGTAVSQAVGIKTYQFGAYRGTAVGDPTFPLGGVATPQGIFEIASFATSTTPSYSGWHDALSINAYSNTGDSNSRWVDFVAGGANVSNVFGHSTFRFYNRGDETNPSLALTIEPDKDVVIVGDLTVSGSNLNTTVSNVGLRLNSNLTIGGGRINNSTTTIISSGEDDGSGNDGGTVVIAKGGSGEDPDTGDGGTVNIASAGIGIGSGDDGGDGGTITMVAGGLEGGGSGTDGNDGTVNIGNSASTKKNATLNIYGTVGLMFRNTATTNGVCHSGTDLDTTDTTTSYNLVACSAAPGDVAEMYSTENDVEAGDIVAVGNETITYEASGGDPYTGQVRSLGMVTVNKMRKAEAGDVGVAGVISTAPFQTFGKDVLKKDPKAKPLALAGRVPVKVNMEGGEIKAGDKITLSSVAGVGKKASGGGVTVGVALQDYDGLGEGKILVLVNLDQSQIDEGIVGGGMATSTMWTLDSGNGHLKPFATLDINNLDITNVRSIISASGNWSISEDGTLTVKKVQTDELCVGTVCVNESRLRDLLENAGIDIDDEGGNTEGGGDDNATTTPPGDGGYDNASSTPPTDEEIPTPEPEPEPETPSGDEIPTDNGGAEPEPIPEPEPEPSPEPPAEETPPSDPPPAE